MMSELGRETVSAYAAAKGGLKMLTRNIASEYGEYNIQCNGIGPGYIATPQTAPLRERQADGSRHPFDSFIVAKTPAARWGTPEDLMGPAVFLASDASTSSTAISSMWTAASWPTSASSRSRPDFRPTKKPPASEAGAFFSRRKRRKRINILFTSIQFSFSAYTPNNKIANSGRFNGKSCYLSVNLPEMLCFALKDSFSDSCIERSRNK